MGFRLSRLTTKASQDSLLDAFHVVITAAAFLFLAAMILFG